MKFELLKLICEHFCSFNSITCIKRVDSNIIKIVFSQNNTYYIDLTKGQSKIYKKLGFENSKNFGAPFDVLLSKNFTNTKITNIWLHNEDKILRIQVQASSSYKKLNTILQFEFTGKHTNAIIINQDEIVLEAMRHISEKTSSRTVKVGEKLIDIQKKSFTPDKFILSGTLDAYLINVYKQLQIDHLDKVKKNKLAHLMKQISIHQKLFDAIESKDLLLQLSNNAYKAANLLLANKYQIKPYQQQINLLDFEGIPIKIELNPTKSIQETINDLYTRGKKYKQKAINSYLEKKNLENKLLHLKKMVEIIKNVGDLDELEFYYPKKEKNQKITKKLEPYQSFFIDGYKILVGRNSKENEWLLKNAKSNDFWFHLQGNPSSHVFVGCTKKEIPLKITEKAAIICAKFSCEFGGDYKVDYTQRKHLKIQNGSYVTYSEYKTIFVRI